METEISYEEVRDANRYLSCAMTIGGLLLASGAEVSRVEDTISRICRAYGADRVDVFTITSSIVVTMTGKPFGAVTQTRRILGTQYDMNRLGELNQLSRDICSRKMTPEEIDAELERIRQEKPYSFGHLAFAYAFISASFALFFGGSFGDAVCSALIGIFLKTLDSVLKKMQLNAFLSAFLCSIAGGLLAILAVRVGIGQSADMINIGNIMLLIPGLALTNGIRDMFNGDMISGLLRFSEALLLSVVLAYGFVLVSWQAV